MLLQEPLAPIAPNARGQTGSQDVQEDQGEIDTGGTHRPTGVEKEGGEEQREQVDDTVIDPEVVIEVDLEEIEEEHQEQHRQEEEAQPRLE